MTRVSAVRKPERWVPPSLVWTLLANDSTVSRVGLVVLQRDLDLDIVALLHEIDRRADAVFVLVQVIDQFGDAALVVVGHRLRARSACHGSGS